MDCSNLEKVWADTCVQVKTYEGVDPSQINAFFSRLHPQAVSEGFLMLTAENEFIKTWIERHYIIIIKQALEDLYFVPFNVLIEVDPTTVAQPAPEPTSAPQPSIQDRQATRETVEQPSSQQSRTSESAFSIKPEKELEREEEPTKSKTGGLSPFNSPNAAMTFENFVIGDSNRMAYSMAVAVAETPGKAHLNPLFIYGRSGLGKTHLMRAIQNYINETMPHMKTVYVDSAELLSDYTDASAAHDVEKSSFKNFKTKYEEADVLLIDDVQYFQGKKQTLDIVFQIFNDFTKQGKQLVLSADRAPKNIDIDERYKTRFNSGATFDIQPPEIETKIGIIKSFIEEYKTSEGLTDFSISDDIQTYIAEMSSSNIRELRSAVTKVIYQMIYFNQPDITIEDVRQLLENHFSGGAARRLSVADIQKQVESFYKVSHADLVGKKRARNIIYARQIAIYLCRQMLDLPYNDIGKKFGGKDHSTIMYSFTNVEEKMKENREMREEIEALKQMILEG